MELRKLRIIDARVVPILRALELRGWISLNPSLVESTDDREDVANMNDEEFRIHLAELKEVLT